MDAADHLIYVVDDDFRMREGLEDLLTAEGMNVACFSNATDYLRFVRPDLPSCLVLDVELPDISGLELQAQLEQGVHPSIVFLTGHGDIPSSVRACKAGAVDFLTKPFDTQHLLSSIREAVRLDGERRRSLAARSALSERFGTLSPREREVLPLVVGGLLNKQAAAILGISEITLQIHRSSIMRKLGADSLPTLVRIADALEVPVTHSRRAPL
ncbi:FixJ family two-component response regulator [Variovorax sp. OAS795]|uniref:response regulator transcription factor n=1 Tax=Variovorax sp. OAS795 TaxID=3034231 RepID=UPI003392577C